MPRKVFSQEPDIRGKQIVLAQVSQRHKTYLSYLRRARFGLSGIQAAPQCCKSFTRCTAKVKVQPVGSGFLGNVRYGIDSDQPDHCDFDSELLRYFPAQCGFNHIVGRSAVARLVWISRSRLERSTGKAPCAFGPIAVLNQQHLRGRVGLVDHDRNSPDQPLSGEQSLQEPGKPRWKQPPNVKREPVKVGVTLNETG